MAAVDTTGLTMMAVLAAPFDVLLDLIAAKSAMMEQGDQSAKPQVEGPAHLPPGMRSLWVKLNGGG